MNSTMTMTNLGSKDTCINFNRPLSLGPLLSFNGESRELHIALCKGFFLLLRIPYYARVYFSFRRRFS